MAIALVNGLINVMAVVIIVYEIWYRDTAKQSHINGYSETCLLQTPLGPNTTVLITEVSLFQRFIRTVTNCPDFSVLRLYQSHLVSLSLQYGITIIIVWYLLVTIVR